MKARLTVHDPDRSRRQETHDVLVDSIEIAKKNRADGAVVILTKHNTPVALKMAGRLVKNEAALMQLYRLAMTLAIEYGETKE